MKYFQSIKWDVLKSIKHQKEIENLGIKESKKRKQKWGLCIKTLFYILKIFNAYKAQRLVKLI